MTTTPDWLHLEYKVAEALRGGKVRERSGAGKFRKLDVMSDEFLVSCKKLTKRDRIAFTVDEWQAVALEAAHEGKTPACAFGLPDGKTVLMLVPIAVVTDQEVDFNG